jgi:hypothetical protein
MSLPPPQSVSLLPPASSPGEPPLENSCRALTLLATVCGEYVSGADRGAARELAAYSDLASLAAIACWHGVLPLLARALRTARIDPAAACIQQRARQLALHNLRLSAELLGVITALHEGGTAALAYKGPALAQQLYGDISLRQFSDLDILVAPADVPRALDILHRRGYADRVQLAPRLLPRFVRTQCEWQLSGAQSGTLIELHWAAFPKYFSFKFPVAELQRAAARVTVAGRSVPVPAPDDLLLLLCAHGAKHFWYRLIWLVDVALVLRDRGDDVLHLLLLAEKKGVRRILLLSAALAGQVLRLELPIAFSDAIRRDPALPPLVLTMAQSLYAGAPPADRLTANFVLLRCRERWSDRILTTLRLAFTPGPPEWLRVPLPWVLLWMYPLVRLARALRYLPRVLRRASALIRPT